MKRPHILKETRYLPRKVKGKSGNLAKNKNNGTLPIRNERGNSLLVERKESKLEYTKNKKKLKKLYSRALKEETHYFGAKGFKTQISVKMKPTKNFSLVLKKDALPVLI